jgi:hypothetical protein
MVKGWGRMGMNHNASSQALSYRQFVCELFVERLIASQVLDENGDAVGRDKSKDWLVVPPQINTLIM